MNDQGESWHGWTLVLRRRPARIVTGRPEGGCTDEFGIIRRDCGDDPGLDYREVSGKLQWVRDGWIAGPFAMGSLLFALGSVPGYVSAVGERWDTVTYFVSSLFLISASFLSYREAVDAAPETANPAHRRFFPYQPGRIDWWATAVQLAATVYFSVSTGVAIADDLSASAVHEHVWRPDAIGTICLLIGAVLLTPERAEETCGQRRGIATMAAVHDRSDSQADGAGSMLVA